MQQHMFSLPERRVELDSAVQWLGVRDYLQEAEVVAGMVQQAMQDDPSLRFADMAMLLPDDQRYSHAVRSVFTYAGIPVSGLQADYLRRDLAGEAVCNLLLALDKPAPVIVLASLLSSPLMPWDREEGNRLAAEVVKLVPPDRPGISRALQATLSESPVHKPHGAGRGDRSKKRPERYGMGVPCRRPDFCPDG